MTDTNIFSTKFIFAVLITILGFVLVAIGKVSGQEFLTFAEVVGGTYVLGNVVQKFAPPITPQQE